MDLITEIERSIIKTYRKYLWAPFVRAIQNFKLVEPNDKIAVAVSGGKDSLLLAKLFQELHRHSDFPFDVMFIAMDPGYSKENRIILEKNAELLGIPLVIKNSNVFEISEKLNKEQPCYMCARMRRGFLYGMAQENGCNKLALGHHFDDVIETTLLNIFYASNYKTMVPKIKAANFDNMELIRPMVYIKEEDILRFIRYNKIEAMNCGCNYVLNKVPSKREEMKELIKDMKKKFVDCDKSIFNSATNVNINAVLGVEYNNKKYDFNNIYENTNIKEDSE